MHQFIHCAQRIQLYSRFVLNVVFWMLFLPKSAFNIFYVKLCEKYGTRHICGQIMRQWAPEQRHVKGLPLQCYFVSLCGHVV